MKKVILNNILSIHPSFIFFCMKNNRKYINIKLLIEIGYSTILR